MRLAKEHVKKHGGFFPGRNELAKIIGCSPDTMPKMLKNSAHLKARRTESKGSGKAKEVGSYIGSGALWRLCETGTDRPITRDS